MVEKEYSDELFNKYIKEYECKIAELKAKIHDLENPVCDCMIDPQDERKHYQNLESENIRLRKIIKLLSESI